jgi:hypothetical protein
LFTLSSTFRSEAPVAFGLRVDGAPDSVRIGFAIDVSIDVSNAPVVADDRDIARVRGRARATQPRGTAEI